MQKRKINAYPLGNISQKYSHFLFEKFLMAQIVNCPDLEKTIDIGQASRISRVWLDIKKALYREITFRAISEGLGTIMTFA